MTSRREHKTAVPSDRGSGEKRLSHFVLLIATDAQGEVSIVPLESSVVAGRDDDCDLVCRDQIVSRTHVRFEWKHDALWIEDLNSSNGTFVNGTRVQREQIFPGDTVTLGEISIIAHFIVPMRGRIVPVGSSCTARTDDLIKEITYLSPEQNNPSSWVFESPAMKKIEQLVDRIAWSDIPVLICGETGTGKEVIATEIHRRGDRRAKPIRCLNCGAIPEHLVESVLFGHERGAFTGADRQTKGVFEESHRGTLFLDEIGEMPLAAQVALLRVLESKRIVRVGSSQEIAVDVRVIAASNRDLEQMVARGTFRQDLFYRLNAMPLLLPALRDRREDIVPLAKYLLKQECHRQERAVEIIGIDRSALRYLIAYDWPGNVRELRNVIQRAVLVATGNVITPEELPEHFRLDQPLPNAEETVASTSADERDATSTHRSFHELVRELEIKLLIAGLSQSDGNKTETALRLKIPLRTLTHKLKEYQLDDKDLSTTAESPIWSNIERIDAGDLDFWECIKQFEKRILKEALERAGGNRGQVAAELNLPRRTLSRKLDEYGLESHE